MGNSMGFLWFLGVGVVLYALSTADWIKVSNWLEQAGKVLFSVAIFYVLAKLLK